MANRPSIPIVEAKVTTTTQTTKMPGDVREKISHKTSALLEDNNSMPKENKAKYQQLYQTFKKSLGISGDVKDKEEFDAAFEVLIGQLNKKKKTDADKNKESARSIKEWQASAEQVIHIVDKSAKTGSSKSSRKCVLSKVGHHPPVMEQKRAQHQSYYLA